MGYDFTDSEIEEFQAEALELLALAEASLLDLEGGGAFKNAFDIVFRAFHSLKGAAAMFERSDLQKRIHGLKNDLSRFREATGSVPSGPPPTASAPSSLVMPKAPASVDLKPQVSQGSLGDRAAQPNDRPAIFVARRGADAPSWKFWVTSLVVPDSKCSHSAAPRRFCTRSGSGVPTLSFPTSRCLE